MNKKIIISKRDEQVVYTINECIDCYCLTEEMYKGRDIESSKFSYYETLDDVYNLILQCKLIDVRVQMFEGRF